MVIDVFFKCGDILLDFVKRAYNALFSFVWSQGPVKTMSVSSTIRSVLSDFYCFIKSSENNWDWMSLNEKAVIFFRSKDFLKNQYC